MRRVHIMQTLALVFLVSLFSATANGQNAPTCTTTYLTVQEYEAVTAGSTILNVTAASGCSDPDNGSGLNYTIIDGDDNSRFSIVGEELQVGAADLDAEANDGAGNYESPYKLILQAIDDDSLAVYVSVLVEVLSINDNTPVITLSPTTVSISESTSLGTTVASCGLADADYPGDVDSTVRVSITSGNTDSTFAIDSETCDVTVVGPLDYETTPTYTLTIEATDLNTTDPKTDTETLTINLQDENDQAPDCPFYNNIVEVDENTSGDLTTLECSDPDALPLFYLKSSGSPTLKINSTGTISIDSPGPDYDGGDTSLVLEVIVHDSGNPALTATVTYSVSVVDLDDNVPVFNPTSYTETISESVDLGHVVLTVTATDADVGDETSRITFGFEAVCDQDWFVIDQTTGAVLVNETPEYSVAENVTCQIFAYSSTLNTTKAVADIVIHITEQNSNAPIFSSNLYTGNVSESASGGASVLTVTATDADSGVNGDITFSLETVAPFTIDGTTGQLDTTSSLDYETKQSYLLLVRATDGGSPAQTSDTYLYVTVLADNEAAPSLTAVADQSVSEAVTPGTLITTIAASDSDTGSDGEIRFTLQDATQPFILEPDTGALRVGLNLDRETAATYTVVAIATDQSDSAPRSSSITFTVTVTESNDNAPSCNPLGPLVVTTTTVNIGDVIGTLTCVDDDAGTTLSYTETSGDTNSIFQVDANNGQIRLVTQYVYGTYTYLVTVSDDGTPAQTSLIPVEILVEADLNFVSLPDTESVSESTEVSDIVYNVTAQGAYDLVTYSIQSGNSAGKFSIHPSLGQVRLVNTLDRESQDSYALTIRATSSNGQTLDETLTIAVSDSNDVTPHFANSFTNVSVVENVGIPVTLATLPATDTDQGANAQLSYAIVSGNSGGAFTIDSSGNLILSSPVDYETTQYFDLSITATDLGSPSLTGTTQVYVTVENLNDNAIVVTPTSGTVSLTLAEDAAVGCTAVQIDVSDDDIGTELGYTLTFGNDFGYFSINPNTGALYVSLPLDKENIDTYVLGVEVNSTAGETATVTVSIAVTDVNDNDPNFNLGNYVFEVPHGTVSGTDVGTLTITDSDATSPNNAISVSIVSGNTGGDFTFSSKMLKTAATLDANTNNLYNLVVNAVDGGSPARTGTAYITVHVADEFKTPSFVPTSASVSIEETRKPGSIIFDVDATASGAQEEPTGDLQYSISTGNSEGKFYIEEYTGAVQLLNELSFSGTTSYTLVILAVNKYVPNTLSATFTLTLDVTQVNIYEPIFSENTYTWTVSEDAAIGTSVGKLSATDEDPGSYGTVSYALESNSTFSVDSTTGVVTLTSTLEYSEAKSYNLYVTAKDDAGNTSFTSTAALVISITDVNNHVPSFSDAPDNIYVPETLATNTAFSVIKAVDLDSGAFGTLTYSLVGGNTGGEFSIDSSTGTLSLASTFDFETTPSYNLTIQASDGGTPSLTGTTTVTVNVLDTNDNAPNFGNSRLDLRIGSDHAALSTVTTLAATDSDSKGSDGDFNYVIESGNSAGLFSIDTVTGEIKTTQDVSSALGFYELEVIAVDEGVPALTGTVTVGISVQLVTSPGSGDYDFTINENEPAGTSVGNIPRDGALTILSYSITGGNYDSSFSISRSSDKEGILVTTKSLDREVYAYYQLQVDVTHSTGVKAVTVIVQVTDDNDNAPLPSPNPIDLTLVENLLAGTVIGTVSATDADESGVNTELSYRLSERTPLGEVFLSVDSTTGEISLASPINYEVFTELQIEIKVIDNGGTRRTSTATVDITIVDVDEVVTYTEMDTVNFVSTEFPYDLRQNEVAYTLSVSDFAATITTGDVVTYKTLDYGVFEVDSSTGAMSLYLPEQVEEVTSIFQWIIMTIRSGTTTTAYAGLVRLDTFNRDKHLIAIVASEDESTLNTQRSTLETHLQTFYTSPNRIKIWNTEATTQALARRRLLSTESVALAVVLADSSLDTADQFQQFKTFLEQDAALAPLRSSNDGTPASNVSGQPVAVTSVLPYVSGERSINDDDDNSDSGLDTAVVALIIVAAVAAFTAIVGTLVLLCYCSCRCCRRRRIPREDKRSLISDLTSAFRKHKFAAMDDDKANTPSTSTGMSASSVAVSFDTPNELRKDFQEGDSLDSEITKKQSQSSHGSSVEDSRTDIPTIEEIDEIDEADSFISPSPEYKLKFNDFEDSDEGRKRSATASEVHIQPDHIITPPNNSARDASSLDGTEDVNAPFPPPPPGSNTPSVSITPPRPDTYSAAPEATTLGDARDDRKNRAPSPVNVPEPMSNGTGMLKPEQERGRQRVSSPARTRKISVSPASQRHRMSAPSQPPPKRK